MRNYQLLPREVLDLQKRYESTQARLIEIISQQEARGNVTQYRKRLLAQVNAELKSLDRFAADWVKVVPKEYAAAAGDVYKFLEKDIPASLVARSQQATKVIMQNCIGQLNDAHNFVGRTIQDEVRQAGVDATALKLSMGDTVKQMQSNLVESLVQKGITAIRDKRGREIRLASYAGMVARTTVRETTNTATINAQAEIGNDLVQMTSHGSSCPICGPLEGRVYSISGKDKRYPPLSSAFPSGYKTIHPNCAHSVTPYIEDFDDDAEQTRKFSQRPIDQDPRSKEQIDKYHKEQTRKTQLRNDRNQWERYKSKLPDAPKTLSGFRAMKKANSEKWQNLQGRYRAGI
jgi:hypothetical protein